MNSSRKTGKSLTVCAGPVRVIALLVMAMFGQLHVHAVRAQDPGDPHLTTTEQREAALQWLDRYMSDSDLMTERSRELIRDAVEAMSPSELQEWLEQTSALREFIESPRWQETKTWLNSFLKVQAIYSDEEIAQTRKEILEADADEMLGILKRIQRKHESLTFMHQASQQGREAELRLRGEAMAAQASATKAERSRRSRSANLPLFGTGVAESSKPSKGYRVPGPLITSRQVAQASVWGAAMGGVGLGW